LEKLPIECVLQLDGTAWLCIERDFGKGHLWSLIHDFEKPLQEGVSHARIEFMTDIGAGAGGATSTRAGWLAGTPLALIFGIAVARGPTGTPATVVAANTPAPAATAAVASAEGDSDPDDAPSAYCIGRFLSPFRALAGDSEDRGDTQTKQTTVEVKTTQEGIQALVAPVKRRDSPWLDRLGEVGGHLSERIGGDVRRASVQALIATIADPIDSGLDYEFDIELRALRSGLEEPVPGQRGFYRDRIWLPWDDRAVEPNRRRDSEECRQQLPGVALFRGGSPEEPSVRVLFLVGESPTTGLRQTTMLNALSAQARLDAYAKPQPGGGSRRVRVIGPTFSGSAQSMRAALRLWSERQKEPVHFDLVSGTATGSAVPQWLGTRRARSGLGTLSDVGFSATAVPEPAAECSYLWFLRRRLAVDTVKGYERAVEQNEPYVPLRGVAVLSESGTEFGTRIANLETKDTQAPPSAPAKRVQAALEPPCAWAPSASFQFPFHVSALRDAYETLDQREARQETIARATTLEAPLHDARVALDAEATPSDKTRAAEDVLLGSLLEHLSKREIRHLAIQATDIGDAIFLARRIRDVSPDVRLAFFNADALLLHSDFQREVLGSLVVSAYPFLGLNEFEEISRPARDRTGNRSFRGFEKDNAQGLFNATLVQSAALARPDWNATKSDIEALAPSEYFIGSEEPLPVWISTIGRGVLVPNQVAPSVDCSGRLVGSTDLRATAFKGLCPEQGAPPPAAWRAFSEATIQRLVHDPLASRPHIWDFIFAVLCVALVLDWSKRNAAACRFASDAFPSKKRTLTGKPDPRVVPGETHRPSLTSEAGRPSENVEGQPSLTATTDQPFDRAIARTKWELYAAIGSFTFLFAFVYMGAFYILDLAAHGWSFIRFGVVSSLAAALGVCATAGALWGAAVSVWRYGRSFLAYRRCRDSWPVNGRLSLLQKGMLKLGFLPPEERALVAQTSFAQLRMLTCLAGALVAWVFFLLFMSIAQDADIDLELKDPLPKLTLTALRGIRLTSGVSPSAPILVCLLSVYIWSVGRMHRLSLAHGLSRVTPSDGEADLVSTPIRLILFPHYQPAAEYSALVPPPAPRVRSDAGFTEVERDLLNSIWRPITGRFFPTAAITLMFFPVVLFGGLKPLLTLEGNWGARLLETGLLLSTALVAVTLVQLVQYWFALERVLKRVMEHPLGSAFRTIPAFAADSIDQLVSRTPDEPLRWAACARMFDTLARSVGVMKDSTVLKESGIDIAVDAAAIRRRRLDALSARPAWLERARAEQSVQAKTTLSQALSSTQDPPKKVEPSPRPWNRRSPLLEDRQDRLRATLEAALARRVVYAASRLMKVLEVAWRRSDVALHLEASRVGSLMEPAAAYEHVSEIGRVSAMAAGSVYEPERQNLDSQRALRAERQLSPSQHTLTLVVTTAPPPAEQPESSKSEAGRAPNGDALTPLKSICPAAQLAWLRSAQTFVATVVTLLVQRHIRQFRHFVGVTTGCSLLVLVAVTVYPFEPYRLLLTYTWVMVCSVVGAGLGVFVQMDRNTFISHVSGTAPDRLTLDAAFVLRVLAWTVVPLVGVAAAQYPALANFLFDLFKPFAASLR
jgi:hypothetical protein